MDFGEMKKNKYKPVLIGEWNKEFAIEINEMDISLEAKNLYRDLIVQAVDEETVELSKEEIKELIENGLVEHAPGKKLNIILDIE